ncbi:MAG: 4-hydroxythreonine-4-phosphate dehydrogenase PdxA, partial [Paramuribaculum sp.]|nr:4-hydroxythreonine-4-phosphate dehydrogenase PdxA [Paramuribaculum sp.]
MADNNKLKIGITHGDINGIGYEVIMKALEDEAILELCTPVVYGSAKIAAFYRKALELPTLPLNQVQQASEARDGHYNIINVVGEDTKVEPGQPTRTAGEAAMAALERAVADLKSGQIDVLVTAPINKHEMQSDTFHFPGHTEYLESSLGEPGEKALMVMCSEAPVLRVALLTTHTPIARV